MIYAFCLPKYLLFKSWLLTLSAIISLDGAKRSSPFLNQNEVMPKLSQQSYPSIDFSSAEGLTSRHLRVLQGFIWIMRLKALFLCIWWKQLPPILHSWDRALLELSKFTWWSCEIKVLCVCVCVCAHVCVCVHTSTFFMANLNNPWSICFYF